MSNICKTVSLRTRKIKNGEMLSFYLDYYLGFLDGATNISETCDGGGGNNELPKKGAMRLPSVSWWVPG